MARAYWLMSGAVVAEVCATLSLKGALTNPWLYIVVVIGYVAAFTCLDATLRAGMPIGVAYGIWAALGVALTATLSFLIWNEPMTWPMVLGIGLIILGVLLIELGGKKKA